MESGRATIFKPFITFQNWLCQTESPSLLTEADFIATITTHSILPYILDPGANVRNIHRYKNSCLGMKMTCIRHIVIANRCYVHLYIWQMYSPFPIWITHLFDIWAGDGESSFKAVIFHLSPHRLVPHNSTGSFFVTPSSFSMTTTSTYFIHQRRTAPIVLSLKWRRFGKNAFVSSQVYYGITLYKCIVLYKYLFIRLSLQGVDCFVN